MVGKCYLYVMFCFASYAQCCIYVCSSIRCMCMYVGPVCFGVSKRWRLQHFNMNMSCYSSPPQEKYDVMLHLTTSREIWRHVTAHHFEKYDVMLHLTTSREIWRHVTAHHFEKYDVMLQLTMSSETWCRTIAHHVKRKVVKCSDAMCVAWTFKVKACFFYDVCHYVCATVRCAYMLFHLMTISITQRIVLIVTPLGTGTKRKWSDSTVHERCLLTETWSYAATTVTP